MLPHDALILATLSSSAEWADRAKAGPLLASQAGDPDVDALLRRLLLDEQDTAVTYATAKALLERRDALGLRLVLEAMVDAEDDTDQWLFDAISVVRAHDRTALRVELAAARAADVRLSDVVAELLELLPAH